MNYVNEPARKTPVIGSFDVAVCGGGPAGVAAALRSGRAGANTILIEQHGCLGGIWTAGLLAVFLDSQNKDGMMRELIERLNGMNARTNEVDLRRPAFDPEKVKLLLDELCAEASVKVRLHTRVADARVDDGRLTHAVLESASGREAVEADCFIDCTGDGHLGWLAGCDFEMGHPNTGQVQPMSLILLLSGVRADEVSEFYRSGDDMEWGAPKNHLREAMEQGGCSPSYSRPTLIHIRDDLFALMANHEYGYHGTDADDLTEATLEARREVHNLIDGLRSLGGPWKNVHIVATADQIGVREGRRLKGIYTVSQDDMVEGIRHPDAVCRTTFPVDVHSLDPAKQKGIEPSEIDVQPYDIPLRALLSADVEGLMMAGRCISGDFLAHSSYRVAGNAVAMGEAAGKTAAEASRSGTTPREIALS
ncbi:MAG: FAD-dependent oxidoreductase [Planctomycetes bacterium]|nr:FAD-dependent oxidoreductase [Planctomycetota bacterium]